MQEKSLGKRRKSMVYAFWYFPKYVTYAKILAHVRDDVWWFRIYIYIIFPINKCTKEKYIKNFMTPFYILWIAFSCLKAAEPLGAIGGDNLLFTLSPQEFLLLIWTTLGERLSQQFPSGFEPRTPDWKSSALATMLLFHKIYDT